MTADTARPGPEGSGLVDVTVFRGRMVEPDGGMMTVAARAGTLDTEANEVDLRGDVDVTTADGYRLITDTLDARLDGSVATATGPVEVTGPGLKITAGAMRVTTPERGAPPRVVFNDGVRLLYTPANE